MTITSLLTVLLVLAVFGLIVWLIVTYIPMPPPFKTVIVAVAAIVLIIWLVQWSGLLRLHA
jgi:preprotein translocase subunit SecE